ncbi:MAG: recombination protein RecR [Candidatus Levybacteria bacterium RIFCSPHIGHO2_02_FULL_39_36]|nr:MAG: Recombination protein RecR [Candidatus Levybacteria bacterium GW2011_GWA1_39_11]KKR24744.1 MAG: Recombination protein RecR [Candidatus Levybacteria bacterium GW2011_GWB1_39_7]OGH28426.1 MAG: recombination protein RecR [Candidatus Levybacteria bacterium RIFCSPHIGHO2_02_FULL_39_36]OGH45285.1 MAG: recombination protein RecR [Candidatus Levybacteria bacterium RIFCSPLOWO2_02_FULL_39_26]OGH47126.1 MAG: recombination protein RecR [Candidatus Levybacteria bacterium RIFCSPLOWO2_12_FULL_39_17]
MRLPKAIERVIESFERLPGIGPKTAQRLGFYLLHVPQSELEDFAQNLSNLKKNTIFCSTCFNIGESDPCWICSDSARDTSLICVVEDSLDLLTIERSGKFRGVYHVLHGVIDPLNSIGPDDIYIPQLISKINPSTPSAGLRTSPLRARNQKSKIQEIILATNPTMEGEATALYIVRELTSSSNGQNSLNGLKITRIGRGLPIGADIEYADEVTIERALEGRREY